VGEVNEAWAEAQRAHAQELKVVDSARQEEEGARTLFREAGAAYQAAADSGAGQPEQGQWLWHAATCFSQGQDFARAIPAYLSLLKLRPPAAQLSETCYRLGDAFRAIHEEESAKRYYSQCIATDGPFTYRARYQLAVAEMGHDRLLEAQEMLDHLLYLLERTGAEQDREAHEKTLYTLGYILFRRREFDLAAKRWEEALRNYPGSPTALLACYRLGLCYRGLADPAAHNLRPSDLPDRQQRSAGQFGILLEKAAARFQKVVDDLQARPTAPPLTGTDATLLRDASFALADCRFEQGLYEEAKRLYIGLKTKYDLQVEGLTARKQLYLCYIASMAPEKPEENLELARRTLLEMRTILSHLDEGAFRGRPEPETRAAFEHWLKVEEDQLKPHTPDTRGN
jgi:tetratricopeptide (TPR) repeat protein